MTTWTSPPQVLITRPVAQARNFKEECEAAGFATVSLPCIEIQFLNAPLEPAKLQQAGAVLFTSANAVQAAHRLLPFPWIGVSICAIGLATERALAALTQPVTWPAVAPYNSESFFDQLRARGIPETLTIIKGEGGREWLINALKREGVDVRLADLYRRALPSVSDVTRQDVFDGRPIDIISVTSDEVLKNLMLLAGDRYRGQLLPLPLICNSQRCAELAATLGFVTPARVASAPGDSGQLAQLRDWLHDAMSET